MTSCGACPDPSICRDHGCQQEAWEHHLEEQRRQQEWTEADECDSRGHAYYGDEVPWPDRVTAGRCYCGERRYPAGGPGGMVVVETTGDLL